MSERESTWLFRGIIGLTIVLFLSHAYLTYKTIDASDLTYNMTNTEGNNKHVKDS